MIRIGPETASNPVNGHDERRIVGQALAYWLFKRKQRPFPEPGDFELQNTGRIQDQNLATHFFVLEPEKSLEESTLSYAGGVPSALGQGDMSQIPACDWFPPSLWASFYFIFKATLDTKKPLATSGDFTSFEKVKGLHRSVVMPLGTRDDGIQKLLGAMSYKLMPSA